MNQKHEMEIKFYYCFSYCNKLSHLLQESNPGIDRLVLRPPNFIQRFGVILKVFLYFFHTLYTASKLYFPEIFNNILTLCQDRAHYVFLIIYFTGNSRSIRLTHNSMLRNPEFIITGY